MILISNKVYGRVFSSTYTSALAFCTCTLAIYWVWGLLMLSSMTERRPKYSCCLQDLQTLKKCAEVPSVPDTSVPREKKKGFTWSNVLLSTLMASSWIVLVWEFTNFFFFFKESHSILCNKKKKIERMMMLLLVFLHPV